MQLFAEWPLGITGIHDLIVIKNNVYVYQVNVPEGSFKEGPEMPNAYKTKGVCRRCGYGKITNCGQRATGNHRSCRKLKCAWRPGQWVLENIML